MKFKALLAAQVLTNFAYAGQKEIDQIRKDNSVPALAAAIVSDDDTVTYVSGVRKWGDKTPATVNDKFHLGSDTKAMTATLMAIFVERGLLRWDETLAEALPKIAAQMHPDFADAKIELLTAHQAGLTDDLVNFQGGNIWKEIANPKLDPSAGRMMLTTALLEAPPAAEPGSQFIYSNAGYTVAGAILEEVTGKSWETLMREEIFEPLNMTSCGFGVQAQAKANPPDQPWPHVWDDQTPEPVTPDFQADNPPTLGPAGTVHCALEDWGHFARLHIDGFNGKDTPILKAESFKKLHESYPGHVYTYGGWGRVSQPWADGPVLTHNGSNNLNFASIWLAPAKNLAYLAATNIAGEGGETAGDQAIQAMIQESMGKEKEMEDRAPGHNRQSVKALFQEEEKKIRNDSSVISPRKLRKGQKQEIRKLQANFQAYSSLPMQNRTIQFEYFYQ